MISSGYIPVHWNQITITSLPFVYRDEYATRFEMLDPRDEQHYQGDIHIGHCAIDNLDEIFSLHNEFSWLDDKVYAVHRFSPGSILPFHKDGYKQYRASRKINNVDQIHRIIVFLEDWKDGHLLQVGSKLYAQWKAGDFATWCGETSHMAANLGHEDRYTLQITGIIKQ